MTHLHLRTPIDAPPAMCFEAVLDVDVQVSLERGMRAVAGVTSGRLRHGDIVTWRARHFGVPWRMTSEIVAVDPPRLFVDAMQRGPFTYWRHTHTFEPDGAGTIMHDNIMYGAPLGVLGRAFDAVVLERYLTRLLEKRNRRLKMLIEEREYRPRARASIRQT